MVFWLWEPAPKREQAPFSYFSNICRMREQLTYIVRPPPRKALELVQWLGILSPAMCGAGFVRRCAAASSWLQTPPSGPDTRWETTLSGVVRHPLNLPRCCAREDASDFRTTDPSGNTNMRIVSWPSAGRSLLQGPLLSSTQQSIHITPHHLGIVPITFIFPERR